MNHEGKRYLKGEIYFADLEPAKGSEQGGSRPVIVFQNESVSKFTRTVIVIPLTTNLRRATLPTCTFIPRGDGGLKEDSVALCHQIRVMDSSRLMSFIGKLSEPYIAELDKVVNFTLDIR
ncbi:MAG: type II toxin-antitoxin system PemK/MazF family toxin [Candidatus Methanoperedens sp.]|nr:type II toxin-antitoxin system PemK/MazF family toxin [Candidatus Methanoperedens sp.]